MVGVSDQHPFDRMEVHYSNDGRLYISRRTPSSSLSSSSCSLGFCAASGAALVAVLPSPASLLSGAAAVEAADAGGDAASFCTNQTWSEYRQRCERKRSEHTGRQECTTKTVPVHTHCRLGRRPCFVEGIEVSLRNVVKFPHMCGEGSMNIRTSILQCAQQLLLRQRPQDRDNWIQMAVIFNAAQETLPQRSGPDLLVDASLQHVA